MLRKSCLAVAALAALVGSNSIAAAQGGPGGGPRMMRSSLAVLLESRDSLQLTADQVARIETLNKETQAKNAPVMEKVRAARESGAGMEGAREFMMQLRKNDEEAFAVALTYLSDEQKPKAKELVERARPQRPRQN